MKNRTRSEIQKKRRALRQSVGRSTAVTHPFDEIADVVTEDGETMEDIVMHLVVDCAKATFTPEAALPLNVMLNLVTMGWNASRVPEPLSSATLEDLIDALAQSQDMPELCAEVLDMSWGLAASRYPDVDRLVVRSELVAGPDGRPRLRLATRVVALQRARDVVRMLDEGLR